MGLFTFISIQWAVGSSLSKNQLRYIIPLIMASFVYFFKSEVGWHGYGLDCGVFVFAVYGQSFDLCFILMMQPKAAVTAAVSINPEHISTPTWPLYPNQNFCFPLQPNRACLSALYCFTVRLFNADSPAWMAASRSAHGVFFVTMLVASPKWNTDRIKC